MSDPNPYAAPHAEVCKNEEPVPLSDQTFILRGSLDLAEVNEAKGLANRGFFTVFAVAVAAMVSLVLALVSVLIPLGILLFVVARNTWRNHVQQEDARNRRGIFAPSEIFIASENIVRNKADDVQEFAWSNFFGFRSNTTVAILLLRYSPGYLILARTQLVDGQWFDLLQMLQSRLPKV